jgi:hypothetical protein
MTLKRLAVASLLAVLLPLRARAMETKDLLALVAMPLAVAAVSEMSDVPQDQLIDVVTLLNDAGVPPAQFIEVVRYVPVALVAPAPPEQPAFVDFVRTQEQQGVRGTQLVTAIEDRFRTMGVPAELTVTAPRVVEADRDEFIPEIVRTRIAEVKTQKAHPHGGPPGQLKKIEGVQTGAEIVHRDHDRVRAAKPRKIREEHVIVTEPGNLDREMIRMTQEQPHGHGHGNGKGNGGGHGKGKGKGKG